MEAVEKSTLLRDEMILELLELLKQNSMPQEANHMFELCAYIDSLEKKLDAMVNREVYSKSKTAPTEEEREKFRQEYLDRRGVPESFRW